METIQIVLIMLILIVISNVIYKYVPNISIPLIQIILGFIVGMLPLGIRLHIETEMFMLLFIAPILFFDGKKFSNRELWDFKKPILYMALGLVFSTVLICGYIIYLIVPELPLPVAFAVAAILSPTDAVAVKAILKKVILPHKVTTIVEGESLLNDASGLVVFNFALAAHFSGVFSIRYITMGFIYVAIGSIILGVIFGYIINLSMLKLKDIDIEEPVIYTLIQIVTPFAVFLFAEEFDLSGVLAVVFCGVTLSLTKPKIMTTQEANIKFVSDGTWATAVFALNGLIFLLLGMALPDIFLEAVRSRQSAIFTDIGYIFIISFLLIAIRYIWVYLFIEDQQVKNSMLISLSGVRGALTLAACLSIPLVMNDGIIFAQRDLILFISSGVIIFTLVVANILLPRISYQSTAGDHEDDVEDRALEKVINSSLEFVKSNSNNETKNMLVSYFEYTLHEHLQRDKKEMYFNFKPNNKKENYIFSIGLNTEAEEIKKLLSSSVVNKDDLEFRAIQIQKIQIQKLLEHGEISCENACKLRRNISLEEAALFEDGISEV